MTTETFTVVQDQWRIRFTGSPIDQDFEYSLIDIFVYRADGSLVTAVTSQNIEKVSESYIHESGVFYLDISGINANWMVIIETPR
jgi:hypothetical protein